MSEKRKCEGIWTIRLPENDGKKVGVFSTTKIELFPSFNGRNLGSREPVKNEGEVFGGSDLGTDKRQGG
jgi:hypothetical protein